MKILIEGIDMSNEMPPDFEIMTISMVSLKYTQGNIQFETRHGDEFTWEFPHMNSAKNVSRLKNRPVVYLDQKDWIFLSKMQHRPHELDSKQRGQLASARRFLKLVQDGLVVTPLSACHMSETTDARKDHERYETGLTMCQLSNGWIMRDPSKIRRVELQSYLCKRLGLPMKLLEVFTVDPDAIYHRETGIDEVARELQSFNELEYISNRMTKSLSNADTFLNHERIEAHKSDVWIRSNQNIKNILAAKGLSNEDTRKCFESFFLEDISEEFADQMARYWNYADVRSPDLVHDLLEAIGDMPTMGLFRELMWRLSTTPGRKWSDSNDLNDIFYLTCASGYADYVMGDRKMTHHMNDTLKSMGRKRNIFSNFNDMMYALESDERIAQSV